MFVKTKLKLISDAICGIITLLSMLIYILVGVFTKIWHPTWLIVLVSLVVCAVITIIVNTFIRVKRTNTFENK